MKRPTTDELADFGVAVVLVLTVVGYPLIAPVSLWFDISNRTVSVPFRGLVLSIALAVMVLTPYTSRRVKVNYFWAVWWIFWVWYLFRIVFDAWAAPETLHLPLEEYLLSAAGIALLPAVALASGISPGSLGDLLRWFFLAAFAAAGLNFAQILLDGSFDGLSALFLGRKYTETLNPIWFGHLGVTLVILATCALLSAGGGRVERLLQWFAVVFGGLVLVVSASKGPLLSLFVVFPAIVLLVLRRIGGKAVLVAAGAGGAVVLAIVFFGEILVQNSLFYRLQQAFSGQSTGSIGRRLELYRAGIDIVLDNPILGAGIGPLGEMARYPHNLLLESFMVNGIVGGLLFSLILLFGLYHCARTVISGTFRTAWIPLLYLQYLVGAMVSGSLYDSSIMWGLTAFLMGQEVWLSAKGNRLPVSERVAGSSNPAEGEALQ